MVARALIACILVVAAVSFLTLQSTNSYSTLSVDSELTWDDEAVPELIARGFVVRDAVTGNILFEREADVQKPIASLTKLFIAHSALSSASVDATTTLTWGDVNTEGDAGQLEYGDEYSVRELVFPYMLVSSNDAGSAIERTLTKSYMTDTIDELIRTLELQSTTIVDATGLSAANVSTPNNLAEFILYLTKNDRHLLDITTLRSYAGEHQGWINNDPARKLDSFRGGKHGFTNEAVRTFAGEFEYPYTGGQRQFIVVLLGSNDLTSDIGQLDTFFRNSVTFE